MSETAGSAAQMKRILGFPDRAGRVFNIVLQNFAFERKFSLVYRVSPVVDAIKARLAT